MRKFKLGDILENGWASDDNPHKYGVFIEMCGDNAVLVHKDGSILEASLKWNNKLKAVGHIDIKGILEESNRLNTTNKE